MNLFSYFFDNSHILTNPLYRRNRVYCASHWLYIHNYGYIKRRMACFT